MYSQNQKIKIKEYLDYKIIHYPLLKAKSTLVDRPGISLK